MNPFLFAERGMFYHWELLADWKFYFIYSLFWLTTGYPNSQIFWKIFFFSIPNPRKDGPVPFTIPCKPCAMDKTGGCWTQFPIEPRSPWLDNPSVAKSNTNSQNDPNPSHNLLPCAVNTTLGRILWNFRQKKIWHNLWRAEISIKKRDPLNVDKHSKNKNKKNKKKLSVHLSSYKVLFFFVTIESPSFPFQFFLLFFVYVLGSVGFFFFW